LLGLHPLGEYGLRWLAIDVLWSIAGGLGIGALCGTLIGTLVLYLRREHKEAVGLDDFLALGLIASSYGAALLCGSYGFLAVFAAGVALRATERRHGGDKSVEDAQKAVEEAGDEAATHPDAAPTFMMAAILGFNEQLERIGEIAVVLLLGSMLSLKLMPREAWWFVPLLFCVVRPLATSIGLIGARVSKTQRRLVGWFGIRGIGSVYYLMYAIVHGISTDLAWRLTSLTFTVVATSVLLHGLSVTPLMNFYGSRFKNRQVEPDSMQASA
jgi:NhaP-type Na+/H+ or K+/H+ antiporter